MPNELVHSFLAVLDVNSLFGGLLEPLAHHVEDAGSPCVFFLFRQHDARTAPFAVVEVGVVETGPVVTDGCSLTNPYTQTSAIAGQGSFDSVAAVCPLHVEGQIGLRHVVWEGVGGCVVEGGTLVIEGHEGSREGLSVGQDVEQGVEVLVASGMVSPCLVDTALAVEAVDREAILACWHVGKGLEGVEVRVKELSNRAW